MDLFLCLVFLVLPYGGFSFEMEENAGSDLHEGDIILNPTQEIAMELFGDPTAPIGGARGLMSNATMLWFPRTVPYDISQELLDTPKAMDAINAAIHDWESSSCLKFVRRTTEAHYIEFFKGSGCWSYVGRQGGMQQISLASGCWYKGTIVHEIGHAMGFWHEQSRPDRDQYVTIVWDNIPEEKKHNFRKYSRSQIDSLGIPYDYLAVMHYGKTAFSSNGQPTIIPIDPNVIQLGQRIGLSPYDVKQADLLYRCNGVTTRPVVTPTSNPPPTGPDTCTFDTATDLCGFHNEKGDDFDWTQRLGKTPSGNTGPSTDHTTGRWGWFMYIETSSPRVAGDRAILRSRMYPASGERCLHFYYHMYGSAMGRLAVTYNLEGAVTELWSRSGDQGDAWRLASVQLPAATKGYQIAFVGVRGSSFRGDAAIDDVYFTDGNC